MSAARLDLPRLRFLAEDKRHRERLNQREAAAQVGLSCASYCRFESGKGGVSAHTFLRLASWLGIDHQQVSTFALPTTAPRVMS